ncbi:MAG: pseudouridine-5'-phosphate glycosidase [Actinomycetota bacterium]|nr:pseudouridine-5'-phosphate glycosidase [Actinomycetota bacterium]
MKISPEVEDTLLRGGPVVALESTLISHGLPHPNNLDLAREAEDIVRQERAVPATIAVIEGLPKAGLDAADLELLASGGVPKLSVRDLPFAVTKGCHGATTVAATAHLAARVGISLFATGGIGGVHRGARDSWDVSADLAALARTPVAVVCSGVKSILDVPATLEQLETLGVPVAGFRARCFPGFYLTDSGSPLDWSVESEEEAARIVAAVGSIGQEGCGLVIANPIPEAEQLDPDLHDRALADALGELERCGVKGKDVTPFLLERFRETTGGESLRVNERIVLNNARLAARIAIALSTIHER